MPTPVPWLIRLPEVYHDGEKEVFSGLDATLVKVLGRDYRLIRCGNPSAIRKSAVAKLISWNLPVHHSWPCLPEKTLGFIEKAAQALVRKFGKMPVQSLLVGALDPGPSGRYYRTLASNLRGRALQVFPVADAVRDAEDQEPGKLSLFCMVGKEGLYCGVQSPLDSGGFHPGGTRFIRQGGPDTISRAGAKIAEALHHLRLHRTPPPEGSHWLELGASPGGMTSELLARNYRVTAVDRAPLDARLSGQAGLRSVTSDVARFRPATGERYAAILSDMNGDPAESLSHVLRLLPWLSEGGLLVFTLKTSGCEGFADLTELEASAIERAESAGLRLISLTHLTYNRREFTMFFGKERLEAV